MSDYLKRLKTKNIREWSTSEIDEATKAFLAIRLRIAALENQGMLAKELPERKVALQKKRGRPPGYKKQDRNQTKIERFLSH